VNELNAINGVLVEEYKAKVSRGAGDSYMLTVARDGESPARSIYFYDNAIDAATGYAAYTDWGFAKEFLTVTLYEPTGRVHEKILKRPRGGECVFVRDDYNKMSEILNSIKDGMASDSYNYLILETVKLFSKDNQRFDPERFFLNTGYTGDSKNDR
jgi:hypothetical protein